MPVKGWFLVVRGSNGSYWGRTVGVLEEASCGSSANQNIKGMFSRKFPGFPYLYASLKILSLNRSTIDVWQIIVRSTSLEKYYANIKDSETLSITSDVWSCLTHESWELRWKFKSTPKLWNELLLFICTERIIFTLYAIFVLFSLSSTWDDK